jgi:hypothetical protein
VAVAVVAGALANKPGNGGEAWVRLSWVLGLRRLGFEVWLVEQLAPHNCVGAAGEPAPFEESANLAYFRHVCDRFDLADTAALICGDAEAVYGATPDELLGVAGQCEVLLNVSGHLTWRPFLARARRTVYLDIDPGFTQFWQLQRTVGARLEGHDVHFTIAENMGAPDCLVPALDVEWRRTRPPVVLEHWPPCESSGPGRFTTVASWRGGYGPVEHNGHRFGLKVHEFRRFAAVPGHSSQTFEIALAIDPADARDRALLLENGWRLTDPAEVAGDPLLFRRYVQGSGAEFSVAQGMYVDTRSGWFSDRTVAYLASGKPVLVQDTGFAGLLPADAGLVAFSTFEEAVAGAESISSDYERHARAARRIAEDHFDSDRVVERLLDEAAVAA